MKDAFSDLQNGTVYRSDLLQCRKLNISNLRIDLRFRHQAANLERGTWSRSLLLFKKSGLPISTGLLCLRDRLLMHVHHLFCRSIWDGFEQKRDDERFEDMGWNVKLVYTEGVQTGVHGKFVWKREYSRWETCYIFMYGHRTFTAPVQHLFDTFTAPVEHLFDNISEGDIKGFVI